MFEKVTDITDLTQKLPPHHTLVDADVWKTPFFILFSFPNVLTFNVETGYIFEQKMHVPDI